MEKFSKTLTITGSNEAAVIEKLDALKVLAGKLKTNELKRLAHVVEHEPMKTALAKKALGL